MANLREPRLKEPHGLLIVYVQVVLSTSLQSQANSVPKEKPEIARQLCPCHRVVEGKLNIRPHSLREHLSHSQNLISKLSHNNKKNLSGDLQLFVWLPSPTKLHLPGFECSLFLGPRPTSPEHRPHIHRRCTCRLDPSPS